MHASEAVGEAGRGRQVTLVALSFATFLVTGNGTILSPFLLELATELETDLAAAGNLVGILSITWGISSVFAGTASDRLGRKPLLIGGLLVLVASLFGVVFSGSYPAVAAWRFIGGFGGGAYMGTVFAAVSDRFPPAERGRALGWIVTAQSLSLAIGIPIITYIGGLAGWRGALAAQGACTVVAAAAVWLSVPWIAPRRAEQAGSRVPIFKIFRPSVVALLGTGTAERVCYSGVAVFLPTFLLANYELSFQLLAVVLFVAALGNVVGNFVGGHLTDRLRAPLLLVAASLTLSGLLALPLLSWRPGLAASIGLAFAYSLASALSRPALLKALSEVSNEARGMVMGLNITFSSFGWITASAIGGWLIALYGFGGLATLTAAVGVAGAMLAIVGWMAGPRRARQPA